MRALVLLTIAMFAGLQYTYWFGSSGYFALRQLEAEVHAMQIKSLELKQRNQELRREIQLIREHPERLEEIARYDLGMITADETFYFVAEPPRKDTLAPQRQ